MTSALVAAGLAALASVLALGPGRTALPAYDGPGRGRAGRPLALAAVAVVVVGAAVALLDGTDLVVALIGPGARPGAAGHVDASSPGPTRRPSATGRACPEPRVSPTSPRPGRSRSAPAPR